MSTIDVTDTTFAETLAANDIVLVDFWADWCGPCKQFAPVFEKSSEDNTDVVYGKIDTEDQQQLAAAAQITSIPTLMAFKNGVPVFRQAGSLPAPALADLVAQLKALDVEAAMKAQAEADAAESAPSAPVE